MSEMILHYNQGKTGLHRITYRNLTWKNRLEWILLILFNRTMDAGKREHTDFVKEIISVRGKEYGEEVIKRYTYALRKKKKYYE